MHFNAIQMEEKNKAINEEHLGGGAKLNLGIDFDFYSTLQGFLPVFIKKLGLCYIFKLLFDFGW